MDQEPVEEWELSMRFPRNSTMTHSNDQNHNNKAHVEDVSFMSAIEPDHEVDDGYSTPTKTDGYVGDKMTSTPSRDGFMEYYLSPTPVVVRNPSFVSVIGGKYQ